MDTQTLLQLLITHFDVEELKTLCATSGVDYDELGTSARTPLARELLAHLSRRGQLSQLETAIRQQRPDILWPTPGDTKTPDPISHHFQDLIQLLSSDRYQIDKRFVQLTLLIDQGPDAQGLRYTADNQRGKFNSLTALLNETGEKALVLLGQPGSGKTTLLRRLQLDHAWHQLETLTQSQKPGFSPAEDPQPPLPKNPASPADAGAGLPSAVAGLQTEPPPVTAVAGLPTEPLSTPPRFAFFAPLNAYRGDKPGDPPPPPLLWLAREWQNRYPGLPDFNTIFRQGRLILLLDGLNEIPHRDKTDYQERVGEWQAFLAQYAHCGNTVLFSCRNLDYSTPLGSEAVPVRRVQVEPLTPAQIETFLNLYLGDKGQSVWDSLRHDDKQLTLFGSPFFLRLLVDQVKVTGEMPNGRSALLTGFVRRALHREVEQHPHHLFVRGNLLTDDDRQQVINNEWAGPTDLPADGLLLPHLEQLAHRMQAGRETPEANQVRLPEKTVRSLLAHPQAEEMIRAGVQLNILDKDVARREITYFHQLLQEYFAARVLAQQPEPERVKTLWHEAEIKPTVAEQLKSLDKSQELPPLPTTGWEESTLLAVSMTPNPAQFIRDLMAVNLPLAARCANLPELTLPPSLKKQLQDALLERINNPSADLRARILAAEALGDLGDPRFSRHTGPHGDYLLPPLVTIPAGSYPIGDDKSGYADEKPAHTIEIATFDMAVYPVTNAEYRLFVDAGGYENEQWWETESAKAWLRGEGSNASALKQGRDYQKYLQGFSEETIRNANASPDQIDAWLWIRNASDEERDRQYEKWYPSGKTYHQPEYWDDSRFNHPSQPVVGITWFEARAYCAWLSAQTGERYDLPTEVEWEAAARGNGKTSAVAGLPTEPPGSRQTGQGRVYAYGNEFDPTQGNTFETHLRRTTPVGVFPRGRTPEGIADLSGNVWEWTTTIWGESFNQPTFTYPYRADDGRENPDDGTDRRVVRGGSWLDYRSYARAACRNHAHLDFRSGDLGCRVVRRPPSHDL